MTYIYFLNISVYILKVNTMKTYVIDGTLNIEPHTENFEIEFELPNSGLKIKGLSKSLLINKKFEIPKEHGIYILEGLDTCYVGQSKDLGKRIKNHNGNNKVDFTRCFILSKRDTDLRQYLDYMEAYTIKEMLLREYDLDNFQRPNPDDDILTNSKKDMTNGWINEFLLFLPILGFRKTKKIINTNPIPETILKSIKKPINVEINGILITDTTNTKVFKKLLQKIGLGIILKNCSIIFDTAFKLTTIYEENKYGRCQELIENNQKYYLYLNISKEGLINKMHKINKILDLHFKILQ